MSRGRAAGSVAGKPAAETTRRRRREVEARKHAILGAARRLFLERGISGSSVEEIARECELAKGTIYLHFRSKEEIAFSLLLKSTEDLLAELQQALDPAVPALQQLRELALTYYRFFRAQPDSFRYMFIVPHESYRGTVSEELIERWGAAGRAALGLVEQLLKQAARENQVALEDPWASAVGLWSAITGAIVMPSQDVRRPFIGDVDVERIVSSTIDWLLAGMKRSARQGGRRG